MVKEVDEWLEMTGIKPILLLHYGKRGPTLAAVSREAGLSSSTLANTLSRLWPKGEWIIANYLNIHLSEIWPSCYFDMDSNLIESKVREKSAE